MLVSNASSSDAGFAPAAIRHVIYLVVVDVLLCGGSRVWRCPSWRAVVLRLACLDDITLGLRELVGRFLAALLEVKHLHILATSNNRVDRLETTVVGVSGSYRITARLLNVYRTGPCRPKLSWRGFSSLTVAMYSPWRLSK